MKDDESERRIFTDGREDVRHYIDEMWVRCPKCGECAIIRNKERGDKSLFAPRRLVCTACPQVADWAGKGMGFPWHSAPADPCFGHPLWLQGSCRGETLWAYNPAHLEFLKRFVAATHRTRTKDPEFGWSNHGMASRLPKWMQLAKNRKAVLKAIGELEEMQGKVERGGA